LAVTILVTVEFGSGVNLRRVNRPLVNRTVLEYTRLLARAFNGAIEVDGTRIVAHPSGTLIARSKTPVQQQAPLRMRLDAVDPENDWSQV
jgi:hypothetical protein